MIKRPQPIYGARTFLRLMGRKARRAEGEKNKFGMQSK